MSEQRAMGAARLVCGALLAGVGTWAALRFDGSAWVVFVLLAAAAVGGFVGRSWWSVALVPAIIVGAVALYGQTDCPDCGGGGEEIGQGFRIAVVVVGAVALTLMTVVGLGIERFLAIFRAGSSDSSGAPVRSWLAAAVVLAGVSVALPAFRYVSNRDENGAIVFDAGRVRYREGKAWDEKADGSMSRAELESFTGYPLYWLGTAAGGYRLTSVTHRPGALDVVNAPGADGVSLIYGTCGPAPCNPPIQINLQPACSATPAFVIGATDPVTLPSGAMLRRGGHGHVVFWSGNSFVTLYSLAQPEFIDSLVDRLRSAQPPGMGLTAPDFSRCPDAVGVG